MPFRDDPLVRLRGSRGTLLEPLVYEGGQGDTFEIPGGFETDFATVPDSLVWLINKTGDGYTHAAVLHDWLLVELAGWRSEYLDPPANSRDADGLFRRVMREEGVPFVKRWVMWTAVRWAALFNRRRAYGRGFLADLPRILPFTVLLLPILPVAALVWFTRLLVSPLRYWR